jgi:hypothetical protein
VCHCVGGVEGGKYVVVSGDGDDQLYVFFAPCGKAGQKYVELNYLKK